MFEQGFDVFENYHVTCELRKPLRRAFAETEFLSGELKPKDFLPLACNESSPYSLPCDPI
jgi:hypothetical protein